MLTEGFAFVTRKSSEGSFDTYCKIEGLDHWYLMAEKNKKNRPKSSSKNAKKLLLQKIF